VGMGAGCESMEDKIKLEAYVASPPTRKCREVIEVMEEIVRRYPDRVRLVVFERGVPWPEEPSRALKYAFLKGSTVPMCYVDGRFVAGGKPYVLRGWAVRRWREGACLG